MNVNVHRFQKFLQVGSVLLIVLLLAACGGESSDDDGDTNTEANNAAPPAGVDTVLASETQVDLAGQRLVTVRGGTVEIRDLTNDVVTAGQDIAPGTLTLLPNEQLAFYAAGTGRYRYYSLDLETLTEQSIMRVSGMFAFPAGLSPNQEWVLVNNPPAGNLVGAMDGSGEYRQIAGFFDISVWLEDNTILTLNYDIPAGVFALPADTPISAAAIYDPSTQTTTELGEDVLTVLDTFNNETALALGGLNAATFQELAFALNEILPSPIADVGVLVPDEPVLFPVLLTTGVNPPVLCGEWALNRVFPDQTTETLYTTNDTLFINNPAELPNGSIMFEHWTVQGCEGLIVRAELLLLAPDGSIQTLTTTLDPGDSRNYNFFFGDKGPRSAVSPDGRYVAWIGGGLDAGYSTLNLYDVAQNVNIELERFIRESSSFSTFHLDTAFTGVAWLPAP